MQQAIYNSITIQTNRTDTATTTGSRRTNLVRRIAQTWDLAGVLALMASGAAYGVYALAHVG